MTGAFEEADRRRAGEWGLEIVSVGVRDIILRGELRELTNKPAATKAAKGNLIVRGEETSTVAQGQHGKDAGRKPDVDATLLLEVLEKVATSGKLSVRGDRV